MKSAINIIFILLYNIQCETICNNKCSTCQNTLFYLKIKGELDCRYTQCPDTCVGITQTFQSNTKEIIRMFVNDQLSLCEACFRLEMCHINDCIDQKTLISNTIDQTLSSVNQLHTLTSNSRKYNDLISSAKEFSYNTELLLSNLKRCFEALSQLSNMYSNTEELKILYNTLSDKLKQDYTLPGRVDFMTMVNKGINAYVIGVNNYVRLKKDLQNVSNVYLNPKGLVREFGKMTKEIESIMTIAVELKESITKAINANLREIQLTKGNLLTNQKEEHTSSRPALTPRFKVVQNEEDAPLLNLNGIHLLTSKVNEMVDEKIDGRVITTNDEITFDDLNQKRESLSHQHENTMSYLLNGFMNGELN